MKQRRDDILLKEIARGIREPRDKKDLSQIDFLIATDINILG